MTVAVVMAPNVEDKETIILLVLILMKIRIFLFLFMKMYLETQGGNENSRRTGQSYSLIDRAPDQRRHMRGLVGISDVTCLDNLRMSRDTFNSLCYLVEHIGGLRRAKNVDIPEQVAMFLNILAYHTKLVMIRKIAQKVHMQIFSSSSLSYHKFARTTFHDSPTNNK